VQFCRRSSTFFLLERSAPARPAGHSLGCPLAPVVLWSSRAHRDSVSCDNKRFLHSLVTASMPLTKPLFSEEDGTHALAFCVCVCVCVNVCVCVCVCVYACMHMMNVYACV
jgi:hypothetical protein